MAMMSGGLDYTGFSRCEVTIEAVVEKLTVKHAVLAEWEEVVPDTAIFASNTSTLPITQIAARARLPHRVVGMHFFNPVHRMPLVEVIRGEKTAKEVTATAFGLAKKLGKTPVVVRDAPGFLARKKDRGGASTSTRVGSAFAQIGRLTCCSGSGLREKARSQAR